VARLDKSYNFLHAQQQRFGNWIATVDNSNNSLQAAQLFEGGGHAGQ